MTRSARALGSLVLVLWGGALARDRLDDWIAATDLPVLAVAQSTEALAADGTLLRAWQVEDGRWRLGATPAEVDPRLITMLVAYEDRRFYRHAGVDPLAVLRAAGQALRHGRVISGGSTLSMQVARLLEGGSTGAWPGKLRQARVALALERRLDKSALLTLYLARAPYGGNVEGLRAAALIWLGKEPARLTPAEAALLVALPQAPEARRPDRNRASARVARDRVLARMLRAGVLDTDTVRAAMTEPVPAGRRDFPRLAPHLTDRLQVADPLASRIETTLDAGLQRSLEQLAATALRGRQDTLSVAILVADHRSGAIRASVGSAGFEDGARQGFVDMTQALRSPGSTLKPLVYALAFDQGLAHPETLIEDRPMAFGGYAPKNFDGQFRGDIRVTEALQLSLNLPVVALTEALGPARLIGAMQQAGARPVIPGGQPGLAVALGGLGLNLQDLVQIYAGLGNAGLAMPLHSTGRSGTPVRITTARSAWQVGHALAGLVPPPGAPAARIAWKTGTSYGHRDAWAVGYDGEHVIGVWMGRPDGTPVPGAFGGDLAAPVLFQALARIKPTPAPLPPPPPETLLLSNDRLPPPLQRFRGRGVLPDADAPKLAFPPDGAELALEGAPLTIKLRDGLPPFTLLADGTPVLVRQYHREVTLPVLPRGYVTLSVIDAAGRVIRATVRID